MFRSSAARYSLIGFMVGITFAAGYTLVELSEARLPTLVNRLMTGMEPEYWLVLLMPLVCIGLGYSAGKQRDRIAAYAREREDLNEILRTLLPATDADVDQNLAAALQPIRRAFNMNSAALLTREHQQWQVRASNPQQEATLLTLLQELPWPPPEPRQITTRSVPALEAAESVPFDPATTAHCIPISADGQPAGWLILVGAASTALRTDYALLYTVADQVGAVLARAHQYTLVHRRARDLEAITQINRLLLAGMSLDELLKTIVDSAQVRFGLPYVMVMWIDEAADECYMRAQAGPLTALAVPNFRQKLDEGLAAHVLRTGQPYLARNTDDTPEYIPAVTAPIRSLLLTPLKTAERVMGVMTFESQAVDAFSGEEVAALTALSDQAAIAAENARLLAETQRERQRIGAILHSTRDVVLLMGTDDRILMLNPAAEQLIGLTASAVMGKPIGQLPFAAVLEAYQKTDIAAHERSFETTWDNQQTYLVTITPAKDEAGTLVGRVVIMRDITYLKRLDQFKSQMVQMVSHDLRTPLGVALGYLELLQDDLQPLTQFREKTLQGMEAALNRMQLLVTELLDLERVESGVGQVRTPVAMAGLIAAAAAELAEAARAKQHQIELMLQPQLPTVVGDPMRLKQAIENVINNAVKYTPAGGSIWVRAQHDQHRLLIEVQDSGYGIPASAQAKLFQRFFRARIPGTEDIEGTGLGLSLVKTVIEQHGGGVSVESEEGHGSTFRLWLPVALNGNED